MSDFTPRAKQVLALARKEAERFNHSFVGTEHLLLELIKLGEGVAVNVLQTMGLDLDRVRMEVEKLVGSHPETKIIGNILYTPRVKKVFALAGKEAKALNHSHVGTEHILLGLLRVPRRFTIRSARFFPGGCSPARNIPKWRRSNFLQRFGPMLPSRMLLNSQIPASDSNSPDGAA